MVEDLRKQGVLFISAERCFSLKCLKLFANLHFRCFMPSAGAAWCSEEDVGAEDDELYDTNVFPNFDKLHTEALLCCLAIKELQETNLHNKIVVDDGISAEAAKSYDVYLHTIVSCREQRCRQGACRQWSHESSRKAPRCFMLVRWETSEGEENSHEGSEESQRVSEVTFLDKKSSGWFMVCDPRLSVCYV